MLLFVAVAAFLLGRWSRQPDFAVSPWPARLVPDDAPARGAPARGAPPADVPAVQRLEAPASEPLAKDLATEDAGAAVVAPERSTIASLQGPHAALIDELNRVLREAGKPEVPPDRVVAAEDLELLGAAIEAHNTVINEAAVQVLEFMDPFSSEMAREIKTAVDTGEPVPFEVLPKGLIPKRGPYDLLATCAYRGVVYAATMPHTPELFELVDRQRRAENVRLVTYLSWVERLR
jgi:hypothetical protein